jgi:ABC-type antimicrobial peptide transport system permease subunit
MALAVRTAGPPGAALASVRARLLEAEPGLPIYDARPMDRIVADAVAEPRFSALLMASFAGLALVLAAVGIYGVIAYSVRRRTREIGVRVALGAARDDILRLVLGRGMGLVAAGIALGLPASALLTRGLRGFLFGVSATDPWTFGALALFLAAVGCAACYLPTRRALSVDPRIALESE